MCLTNELTYLQPTDNWYSRISLVGRKIICFHIVFLAVLMLVGCSGSNDCNCDDGDNGGSNMGVITIPESFNDAQAVVDKEYVFSPQHIDVYPFLQDSIRRGITTEGMIQTAEQTLVGLSYRVSSGIDKQEHDKYALLDIDSLEFSPLLESKPLSSVSLSNDFSTAAWIEECQGYIQALQNGEAPMHMNQYVHAMTCFRPAQVSATGNTVIFSTARGETGDDEILRWVKFDSSEFGPVVMHRPSSRITTYAMRDIVIDGVDGPELSPWYLRTRVSQNGDTVAMRLAFLPKNISALGEYEYTGGILLIDAASGTYTFIDSQRLVRSFCMKCYFYPADNMQISGDGKYLFFLRPEESDLLDPMAVSTLFRFDIENKELAQLPIDDRIEDETLVVDRSGSNIGYLADGKPVLLNLETGSRVEIEYALRGCAADPQIDSCDFDSFRFVHSSPLAFSDDGSQMTIRVIPQNDGAGNPQNTLEVMRLDTQTLALTRMTPNIDVEKFHINDGGDVMVFTTETGGLIPNDNDFDDEDLFVIR